MKKKLQRSILFILFLSFTGLLTAQTNLLPSNFFGFEETDPTGWFMNAASDPYVAISNEQAATGTASLKFNFPDYSALSDGSTSINAETAVAVGSKVDVAAGTYTMKVKVYVVDNAPGLFKTIFKPGWIQVDWDISGIETGKWVELEQTVTLPEFVDGGMVIQIYQTAFTVMEGAGSFYVDDIEIFSPLNDDLDDPETPIDEHYFSFELGADSWYTPAGMKQYVEINDLIAASGNYSNQFSFADYSTVYNSVSVWTQSKPDWNIDFEMGKFYEIKLKIYMEDATDALFPSGFGTYIKGDGGIGYQIINWDLDGITQRDEWVEKTQIFRYSGEGLSQGESVSRQLVIQISQGLFPETGSGTFHVDDISIVEIEQPTTYPIVLAVDPSEIATDANVQGAGDYIESMDVQISASAVTGYDFTGWTGNAEDVALLVDANALATSFTMPDRNISLTATFSVATQISKREMPVISVYPVPAVDIITVEATEMMQQIRIMDISGKIVSDHVVHNLVEHLNVNNLFPGHYYMQVITSDQSLVLPVQIVR